MRACLCCTRQAAVRSRSSTGPDSTTKQMRQHPPYATASSCQKDSLLSFLGKGLINRRIISVYKDADPGDTHENSIYPKLKALLEIGQVCVHGRSLDEHLVVLQFPSPNLSYPKGVVKMWQSRYIFRRVSAPKRERDL